MRHLPKTDKEAPKLAKLLNESVEPIAAKLQSDTDDPSLKYPSTDSVDPQRA
jgi:hypothetical protein